jgi:hypothetical protein
VKFAFIRSHQAQFPVEVLCDVLKVSRSGYYAWMHQPASPRAVRRQQLVHEIRQVHGESRATYGSPRIRQPAQVGDEPHLFVGGPD